MSQAYALQERTYKIVNSRAGARFDSFLKSPSPSTVVFLAGVQRMFVELNSHPASFILFTGQAQAKACFFKKETPIFCACRGRCPHVSVISHPARTSVLDLFLSFPGLCS